MAAKQIKSLLTKFSTELTEVLVKEFDLDSEQVQKVLNDYFSASASKKGSKGPSTRGRSAYMVFSENQRPILKKKNPEMKATEIMSALGTAWKALSEAKKKEWQAKADAYNKEHGLGKNAPVKTEKTAAVKTSSKTATAVAAAPANMKVTKNKDADQWVVTGTNFVVASVKNKVVIGKLDKNKVVALTKADLTTCKKEGYPVDESKRKEEEAEEEEEEAEEEEEEEAEEEEEEEEAEEEEEEEEEEPKPKGKGSKK
jgi:hypothetical protein